MAVLSEQFNGALVFRTNCRTNLQSSVCTGSRPHIVVNSALQPPASGLPLNGAREPQKSASKRLHGSCASKGFRVR